FYSPSHLLCLHSFPTRRSSDLIFFSVTSLNIATYQGPFVADSFFPNVGDHGANIYDPDTIYVTGWAQNLLTGVISQHVLVTKDRSEEHTSELQSRSDLVCRLLL